MRAMVVDDSGTTRSILRRILTEIGFKPVLEAENGEVGLTQLQDAGALDLCMVDLNMPGMNGLDFIKAVRADKVYEDMTIVMVTTEVDRNQMARAIALGANEYIMKPFTPEIITEKLAFLGFSKEGA